MLNKNKNMLVAVANSSEAVLFDATELRKEDLKEFAKLEHLESRKKNSDLVTDGPGYMQRDGGAATSYESKVKPKDVEAEHFAMELVKKVYDYCNSMKMEHLVIAAPTHFYNYFIKHWHHHNLNFKLEHIAKDYTKFTVKDLTATMRQHLFVK